MAKIILIALTGILAAGLFFMPAAQTKTISVSGTVVDSLTGVGIPQAMILLYAAGLTDSIDVTNVGSLKFDTVFSGTNGKFQQQMTISSQALLLFYGVLKVGYVIKYSTVPTFILSTTVAVPTIKITKMDTSAKDTLLVSGTVVDSSTGKGINGAHVIMTTGGGFDTLGNTVFTGTDGKFSKQVIINKANGASIVSFIITAPNYQSKLGKNTATGKQLDLGSISLISTASAIRPKIGIRTNPLSPNRMKIYALNGQLIYDGTAHNFDNLQHQHGEAIVELKYNASTISVKKYSPVR